MLCYFMLSKYVYINYDGRNWYMGLKYRLSCGHGLLHSVGDHGRGYVHRSWMFHAPIMTYAMNI